MKRVRHTKTKNTSKFIRIDAYTWIEKKVDEPDEVARQKFLMKLSGFVNNPNLKPLN